MKTRGGFTLIEILLAALAASLILGAVYGIFHQAVHIRDNAVQRIRDSRGRLRAEKIIRGDLGNALLSGGLLASVLQGDSASPDNGSANTAGASHPDASNIPGYLRFTTTTGRNDASTGLYGDVQQVEYYIAHDPNAADQNGSGVLMRAVTRDLLDASGLTSSTPTTNGANATNTPNETAVLAGVQSFQVSFYDGANWQTSWQFSDLIERISPAANVATTSTGTSSSAGTQVISGQTSLPDAVRIDIQQAPATPNGPLPPPLEILVPWTTQPFVAATPAASSNAGQ